ncbi:SMC-Scp complex subunit ScpB [Propionibacteriaceae bacterium Y2011]
MSNDDTTQPDAAAADEEAAVDEEATAVDEQAPLPSLTPQEAGPALEALLLMAEEPMPAATMATALDVPIDVVVEGLQLLRDFYDETGRGFELRHLGGGWRYYTRSEHADVISAHVLSGQQAKLSQAGLETLAVIAYRQPISRARVSAVRGVNVDGVVRTLLARNLIAESGQDAETGAVLFVTTEHFLERMGLDSLADLPPLAPHLPEVSELEAELSGLAEHVDQPATTGDHQGAAVDHGGGDHEHGDHGDGDHGDTDHEEGDHEMSDQEAPDPDLIDPDLTDHETAGAGTDPGSGEFAPEPVPVPADDEELHHD